ncbi:uncharacterized protein LOC115358023 [Myripristis murdjan]|uniref:uncharacterized protein LOC115358023 n=1 Tax=Myripristis murdjan TaxID=586833 RepID=UPI0011763E8B|nr:uncharacterized protein LOC115358023 [Myripristis murdjan]
MKFTLSLGLLLTLLSTAEALECHEAACTVGLPCRASPRPRPCSEGFQCVTTTLKLHLSGSSTQFLFKSCLPNFLCSAGTETVSLNLGFGRVVGSVKCCNTDRCNSQNLTVPAHQGSNSLQCYSCDSSTCRNKVQCVGGEDRCFKGSVMYGAVTAQIFGCTSANLCTAVKVLPSLMRWNIFPNFPTCCKGNLCNSASAAKLSVFSLLFGLMSLTVIF